MAWKDLVALKPWQVAYEVLISIPWLGMELWFLYMEWWAPALLASFFFFLTALRSVHAAFHFTLGIPRWWTKLFLILFSGLMLGSLHAVGFNHLRHHRHCLDPALDVEGSCARMSAWKAILYGPQFQLRLHRAAFKSGSASEHQVMITELALNLLMAALAIALLTAYSSYVLLLHIGLMAMAQCLTGFFAVWTVHHDCDDDVFARTQRGRIKNLISYDMFYHIEHHLFPGIPQQHLPRLAARLDKAVPELTSRRVF